MTPVDKLQLEMALKSLKDSLTTIEQITGAYSIASSDNKVEIQMTKGDFERIFVGHVPCVERLEYFQNYPYEKYVVIQGVKFFCLLKEFKEAS